MPTQIITDKTIDPDSFAMIITLARLEVFEPFEGELNLERMQRARAALEKGVGKVGEWVQRSDVLGKTRRKWNLIRDKIKDRRKNPDSKFARISNKTNAIALSLNLRSRKIQEISKAKLIKMQSRVWQRARAYTLKGFDLLWIEDPQSWILPKASSILGKEFSNIEDLQALSNDERGTLLEKLYPYNSKRFQKITKGFDVSINLSLGLIVASNMPGTGLLVSGINTIKTIVKIASGLQVLATLYGYRIGNKEALFVLCTRIIASMENYESKKDHVPISYADLEPLFNKEHSDQKGFEKLITQALKKEAYIAIPGVGMLSLGKIQLDDYKAHKIMLALMEKRRLYLSLSQKIEPELLHAHLELFKMIFSSLYKLDALPKLKALNKAPFPESKFKNWLQKLAFNKQAKVFAVLEKLAEYYYYKQKTGTRETHTITPITQESLEETLGLLRI